jgi:hypothetical protein
MPLNTIYQRYYILLQPVLTVTLVLDMFIVAALLSYINSHKKNLAFNLTMAILPVIFIFDMLNKTEPIRGHIYELTHQYRGPLDFAIPYIKSKYKDTEHLVIATNYEEFSYMYYLGSKVTIGYVGCNLKEDAKIQPDVIIFRKKRTYVDPEVFNNFIRKARYIQVSIPVLDYLVNNIPELQVTDRTLYHLYKTQIAPSRERCLDICIKQ